jgi:hypothetical protein
MVGRPSEKLIFAQVFAEFNYYSFKESFLVMVQIFSNIPAGIWTIVVQ